METAHIGLKSIFTKIFKKELMFVFLLVIHVYSSFSI